MLFRDCLHQSCLQTQHQHRPSILILLSYQTTNLFVTIKSNFEVIKVRVPENMVKKKNKDLAFNLKLDFYVKSKQNEYKQGRFVSVHFCLGNWHSSMKGNAMLHNSPLN